MLNVPTLMICVAMTVLIVAVAMTLISIFDRRETATIWWAAGLWSAVLGAALLSLRASAPLWLVAGVGNMLMSLAFGLVANGFAVFARRRPDLILTLAGPVLWICCYGLIEAFREEIVYRMFTMTFVMGAYSIAIMRSAWIGWKSERLPSYLVTALAFGLHAVTYVARTIAAVISPVVVIQGDVQGAWVTFFALEGFALSVITVYVFLALIKERAEQRYRLLAEVDALTGASTRHHFVTLAWERLARRLERSALALLDLDHFKAVNDTYGHLGGDRILQEFGHCVKSMLKPGMMFGRLGGEEFAIFMPATGEAEALMFMDSVRAEIEAMTVIFMASQVRVTVSAGLATTDDTGSSFDHLMAAADLALYAAKDLGRNRVTAFLPSMRMRKSAEASSRPTPSATAIAS